MKCICLDQEAQAPGPTCGLPLCLKLEEVAVAMSSATDREGANPKGWTDEDTRGLMRSRLVDFPKESVDYGLEGWLPLVRRRYEALRRETK